MSVYKSAKSEQKSTKSEHKSAKSEHKVFRVWKKSAKSEHKSAKAETIPVGERQFIVATKVKVCKVWT